MKKKGINILAILIAVVVLVIVGVVLAVVLKKPAEDQAQSGGMGGVDLGEKVLHLTTIDEFRQYAESGNLECSLGTDMSGGSIYKVPLLGEQTMVTYYFDAQGNTTDFEAFYFLNADITAMENLEIKAMTTEELSKKAWEVIDNFCLMFGCSPDADIYLTNHDGTFTLLENEAGFQAVAEGNSDLMFSIRAKDGYFWELTIAAAEGLVSVNICKYFNLEESLNYVANISLYETGE